MDANRTIALNFASRALSALSTGTIEGTPAFERDIEDAAHNLQRVWGYVRQLQRAPKALKDKPLSDMGKCYDVEEPNLDMLQHLVVDLIGRLCGGNPQAQISTMREIAACLRDHGAF